MASKALAVLVSRLSFSADNADGERISVKKSFPMARKTNASRGNPNKATKARLGRINTQPGF